MRDALLTITVMPDGAVRAYPGRGFTEEDTDLMIAATGAVNDLVQVGKVDG